MHLSELWPGQLGGQLLLLLLCLPPVMAQSCGQCQGLHHELLSLPCMAPSAQVWPSRVFQLLHQDRLSGAQIQVGGMGWEGGLWPTRVVGTWGSAQSHARFLGTAGARMSLRQV